MERGLKRKWLFGLGAAAGAAAGGLAVARSRRRAVETAERVRRLQSSAAPHGRNIVILGAGYGGLNVAHALLGRLPPEAGWTVTLVDQRNYNVFTPLLYHAATGLVDPTSILFPVRSLSQAPHFSFREARVLDVDLGRRLVQLDDGQLVYDQLVLALGSVTNFFGKEADLRRALTLKSPADAIAIRNRIIDAFEKADIATDADERRRCLTFVVVGAGATGVELSGAIRGLVRGTLARHYPRIDTDHVRVLLLEAKPDVLPGISRDLAARALERLKANGVEVRLECPVERVDETGLVACDGEYIPSRTVVWTAGVRPSPLAAGLNVPKDANGRILVDEFLQVAGETGVYALGDIAAFEDSETGHALPPNAAVAVQEARALADVILARIEDRPPRPFRYVHRGEMVSLGRHEAVAEVGGVHVSGLPAWILWRAFYLSQLMGFKNRLAVALDWSFAYLYQRDTVRLDLPGPAGESSEAPALAR